MRAPSDKVRGDRAKHNRSGGWASANHVALVGRDFRGIVLWSAEIWGATIENMYYHEGIEGAFGKGRIMRSAPIMRKAIEEDNTYKRYRELGGIINEKDYESILRRAKSEAATGAALIKQAGRIAEIAHITPDERALRLYRVMRNDSKPAGVKHHHSQMSDQRLFAEALRMVGDADSLGKLISAHPNISF